MVGRGILLAALWSPFWARVTSSNDAPTDRLVSVARQVAVQCRSLDKLTICTRRLAAAGGPPGILGRCRPYPLATSLPGSILYLAVRKVRTASARRCDNSRL